MSHTNCWRLFEINIMNPMMTIIRNTNIKHLKKEKYYEPYDDYN
jgi:hypothetical protein